jgi:hypothetical protein
MALNIGILDDLKIKMPKELDKIFHASIMAQGI